jgi:hypothetical protein
VYRIQAAQILRLANGDDLMLAVGRQGLGDMPVLAGKVLVDKDNPHDQRSRNDSSSTRMTG